MEARETYLMEPVRNSIEVSGVPLCSKCQESGDDGGYLMEYCDHFYCWNCLETTVNGSSDVLVKCPIVNCFGFLEEHDIPSLVSAQVYHGFLVRVNEKRMRDEKSDSQDQGLKRMQNEDINNFSGEVPNGRDLDRSEPEAVSQAEAGAVSRVPSSTMGPIGQHLESPGREVEDPMPTPALPLFSLQTSEEEPTDGDIDDISGFAQLSITTKFLIAAGYSAEEAVNYLDTQSVLLTVKPITCVICLESQVQPGDGIIIKNCLHMFCRPCLTSYISLNEEVEIECPFKEDGDKCRQVLLPLEVRELCTLETYEKHYVELSLKAIEGSETMAHCMTPNCSYFCELNGQFLYTCPGCEVDNCYRCKVIHTHLTCEEYTAKVEESEEVERSKLIDQQNQRLSESTIEKKKKQGIYRPCPKCGVTVEKNEGCDHMHCQMCKHSYSWESSRVRKSTM